MKQGMTLIESLVFILIFSLILAAVFDFIVIIYRIEGYSFQQSISISEARRGIETMVKEIREAKLGDDGSYIIEEAEDYEFVFYSNIDQDQEIERVRYFIDGSNFKKGTINPTGWPIRYESENEEISVLSQYVRNAPPVFRYYNGEGNELSSPARLKDTKLMRLFLVINVNPNRPPQDFILESSVQIRNLKTNL